MNKFDVISDHSTIEIRVSCKNLDKCNSICIFYEYENSKYIETDRSEVMMKKTHHFLKHLKRNIYLNRINLFVLKITENVICDINE